MQFNEFVGHVQNRARLGTEGETMRAIHATLLTLGERLQTNETDHLAAQLPREIGAYLREAEKDERFTLDEFFKRVSKRAATDLPEAVYHARAVIAVLQDAVSPGQLDDVRAQLPEDFALLFESGSEGML